VPKTSAGSRRAFVGWAVGAYLVTLGLLLVLALRRSSGTLVYAIDDPAIHLSIAQNLIHHGTWGVVPGEFQSASSSPLWTLAVAATSVLLPFAPELGPLLLNVVASIVLLMLLGAHQRVLQPSRHRPADAVAVVALVVVILFLPALTMLGMEHIAHTAMIVWAVVCFGRRAAGETAGRRWLPYLLVALATLTRFETLFVVAGLVAAELAIVLPGWRPAGRDGVTLGGQVRRAAGIAAAAIVPFVGFVALNVAMGQGLLPNSVLSKGPAVSGLADTFSPEELQHRLADDPLLAALAALTLALLLVGWRQGRRSTYGLVVLFVATVAHVLLAQVGWYERYQAYLITLAVFVLLDVAAEIVPAERRAPTPHTPLVAGLVLSALLLSGTKINLARQVPLAVADTYGQRYQAARFLERFYDGAPIATSELGYISLLHDGPVTDVLGLGDYAVLEERRRNGQEPSPAYWAQLADERGFDVVVVYPGTMLYQVPDAWILAGSWKLDRDTVTAWDPELDFYATSPEALAPLQAQLEAFAPELPPGVTTSINELAPLRAEALAAEAAAGD
ncbi:MAG: hypothetical protein KDB33_11805, partial [Acidimicrobiales bacterium]|nr:hypothetical protein [Acidimicrobiales bacterium]